MPYLVVENTPGCPRMDEPAQFADRSKALDHALNLLGELRELGYTVKKAGKRRWTAEQHHLDSRRIVEVVEHKQPVRFGGRP